MGDPVRLQILELLTGDEMPVGELVAKLGLPQNHVSMHLGCLRWCGYVSTRRQGRHIYYALSDERIPEVLRLAQEILQGSEVYLATCEVIGTLGNELTNVTGWRGCRSRKA